MSYEKFAHVYDLLMEEAPYDEWISFTEEAIKCYLSAARSIIDLGCGTGEISLKLAEKGYKTTGVDYSTEMLSIANQKGQEQNLPVTWIEQDIRELTTPYLFDVAVSYCDVINYLIEEEDIKNLFSNVYQLLNKNGLFMFDVHSENYIQNFLAKNTFAEVREDLSYVWLCEQGNFESSVEHDLTFFVKNEQGLYERFDEYHVQRTFPIAFYREELLYCGFKILGIYSDFSNHELNENGDRIFFICQKI